MKMSKASVSIPNATAEAITTWRALDFPRRYREVNRTPPTDDEITAYRQAAEALDLLRSYPGFIEGHDGVELIQPQDHVEYEYTETHEEWTARVDAAHEHHKRTGEWPEDTKPLFATMVDDMTSALAKAFDTSTQHGFDRMGY